MEAVKSGFGASPESGMPEGKLDGTRRSCPACGHASTTTLFWVGAEQVISVNSTYRVDSCSLLGVSKAARFPFVRCCQCRFVFAGQLPASECLNLVYDEAIDPERGFFESVSPGWVAHQLEIGSALLKGLVKVFEREPTFRVLDFGCGYGSLVRALMGPRVRCLGFESSDRRLAYLRAQGIPAVATIREASEQGPYHAVILSDVLEHVPEPRVTLACCRDLLLPGGLLLVTTPDFGEGRLTAVRDAIGRGDLHDRELNPWEHLNYFSPSALDEMLHREGFLEMESSSSVDVGLRPGLMGILKWGNAAMSLVRLIRHLMWRRPEGTYRLARLSGDVAGLE